MGKEEHLYQRMEKLIISKLKSYILDEHEPVVMDKSSLKWGLQYQRNLPYFT